MPPSSDDPSRDDSNEQERLRVREVLLDLANRDLADAVFEAQKKIPMRDIAAFIEGDETTVKSLFVGRRSFIAKKVRARDASPEGAHLADLLVKGDASGMMPCAFVVRFGPGAVDVSIVMLRMHPVN